MSRIDSIARSLGYVPHLLWQEVHNKLANAMARGSDIEQERDALYLKHADAERLASAAQRTARDYRDKLTESDAKLLELETTHARTLDTYTSLGNTNDELRAKVAELNDVLEGVTTANAELGLVNDTLRTQVGALEAQIAEIERYPRFMGACVHDTGKDAYTTRKLTLDIELVGPGGLEVGVEVRALVYSKKNNETLRLLANLLNKYTNP